MKYFIIIFLLLSSPVYSIDTYNPIVEDMKPSSITIIGETHRRPESIQFFQSLISRYLQQNKCLVVALEIASSQQIILDEIMQGTTGVSDIEIPPMIDHPPFRALIDELAGMERNGACLKLIAIDAGLEVSVRRDKWMADKLAELVSHTPILTLLGSLHTLKKVNWDLATTKASPYVAEILVSRGHQIKTYPQIWLDKSCKTANRLISSDEAEAAKFINSDLISLLNAFEYRMANNVVDGVVVWECD